jgi:N-methylhydantoinase B
MPGSAGVDRVNGERIAAKAVVTLRPGDVATFETPGGGGMFSADGRDREALRRDLRDGLVSPQAAVRDYAASQADVEAAAPLNSGIR